MSKWYQPLKRGQVQTAKEKQMAFSRIEFMFWFTLGTWSFVVPLLNASGMSPSLVGIVMSVNALVGFISPPIWGTLSDKVHSVKKVLIICFILTAINMALLPMWATKTLSNGTSMLVIMVPIMMFFHLPTTSLLDTWLVSVVGTEKTLDYGKIRVFGSIGYTVVGVIYTQIVDATSVYTVFYSYAIFAVPTLLLFLRERDVLASPAPSSTQPTMQKGGKLFNYYFVTWLIFLMIINIPIVNGGTFVMYMITETGGSESFMGTLGGLRALMEVVFMVLGGTLMKKISLKNLIIFAGVLYVGEQLLYPICQTHTQVLFVAFLNGLAYGLFLPCFVNYTAKLAPPGSEARAQTIAAAMYSFCGIIVNTVGGKLVDPASSVYIGVRAYYTICGIVLVAGLVFFALSIVFGEKKLKLPRPAGARKPM